VGESSRNAGMMFESPSMRRQYSSRQKAEALAPQVSSMSRSSKGTGRIPSYAQHCWAVVQSVARVGGQWGTLKKRGGVTTAVRVLSGRRRLGKGWSFKKMMPWQATAGEWVNGLDGPG
jgi:hypothetical protein